MKYVKEIKYFVNYLVFRMICYILKVNLGSENEFLLGFLVVKMSLPIFSFCNYKISREKQLWQRLLIIRYKSPLQRLFNQLLYSFCSKILTFGNELCDYVIAKSHQFFCSMCSGSFMPMVQQFQKTPYRNNEGRLKSLLCSPHESSFKITYPIKVTKFHT